MKDIKLMTHVVAGYPSLAETEQLVIEMEKAGVSYVEIQIPFSDPLADGPTIMMANDKALANGTTIEDAFSLMERLTKKVSIPLLFMGYYNSVFQYGVERFCKKAQQVGAHGLIIPDVPLDEESHEQFLKMCDKYKLASIRVLSPTSSDDRIEQNLQVAKEFVYCTAISGITGSRNQIHPQTKQFLKRMRSKTDLPLAVGFGISKPEHVQALKGYADIAVVGSAVIKEVEKGGVEKGISFIKRLIN